MDLESTFPRLRVPFHLTALALAALPLAACSSPRGDGDRFTSGAGEDGGEASSSSESEGDDTADDSDGSEDGNGGTEEAGEDEGETGTVKFDVEVGDMGSGSQQCTVTDDMDAIGNCQQKAPPESFQPEVQWSFNGMGEHKQSIVTPLVANLTDDNDDGEIDLCDVPDVIVAAFADYNTNVGPIYVIDGATGSMHYTTELFSLNSVTPAVGDIDGDGIPEIVTMNQGRRIMAFEHDGSHKWTSDTMVPGTAPGALAIADFDNDDEPEIYASGHIFSHEGVPEVSTVNQIIAASTAADVDDDGDLELILGHHAYHHDGTPLYTTDLAPGFPQVADLDDDGDPEVLVTNWTGLNLVEMDGTIVYSGLTPTGDEPGSSVWWRPATVHDIDGDGVAEFASSSRNHYSVFEGDASVVWSADVVDATGVAAGTAFDFLGDGTAEAMYADETSLFVFGEGGDDLLSVPRSSGTIIEYPVVADVDNDQSAEIVVVSNASFNNNQTSPLVQVVRDVDDRWIQARRIWNQHTYHVTNVREDGTIPQFEAHHWESLNTFRTNAQIEGSGICIPEG